MAYINQYNDAGTLYDLQDIRIGEHLDSAAGKPLVAATGGGFQLADAVATKSTGNLSLKSTTNEFTLIGATTAKPWSKLCSWQNKTWGARASAGYGGDIVVSSDGYSFGTIYSATATTESFYDIAGNNRVLVATSWDTSGYSKIYYYYAGAWTAATLPIDVPQGIKLSLVTGNNQFMAVPNVSSVNWALFSTDGITWTKFTFGSGSTYDGPIPLSNIFYHDGFKYIVAHNSAEKIYELVNNSSWVALTNEYELGISFTNIYCFDVNGVLYEYLTLDTEQSEYAACLLSGLSILNIDLIAGYTTAPFTFSDLKIATVISDTIIIWTGGNFLLTSLTTDTTFTQQSISYDSTVFVPDMVCEINGTLYASDHNTTRETISQRYHLYSNNKRGVTSGWLNGLAAYILEQSNDGADTDITRILVNLVKNENGVYQLTANDIGAIPAPISPSDGQVLTYNLATATWIASALPTAAPYVYSFTTSSWSSTSDYYTLSVTAATHGCGTNPQVEVYKIDQSNNLHKYYGFPSTGWELIIGSTGNVEVRVYDASAKFNGKLVIR